MSKLETKKEKQLYPYPRRAYIHCPIKRHEGRGKYNPSVAECSRCPHNKGIDLKNFGYILCAYPTQLQQKKAFRDYYYPKRRP